MGPELRAFVPPHCNGLARRQGAHLEGKAPSAVCKFFGGTAGFAGNVSEDQDVGMDVLDEKWNASLVGEFDDHKCVLTVSALTVRGF